MENKLRCNKILITGGGSGIGKAIAKRFVDEGAYVTILGRNPDKLNSAKSEIQSDNLFVLQGDVSKTQDIKNYILKSAEMMGGLDGVVNNAGVSSAVVTGRGFDPWDITPDEWDTVMNINLKGAFFVMREAIEYMKVNAAKGNILNISSNAAFIDIQGPYGVSKLAVHKFVRTFAKRFGDYGIVINGIAPGATATDMIARYCKDEDDAYPQHAIGRFVKPSEMAELAYYLMSELGEIMCGHTVVADGGDKKIIVS